MDKDTTQEISEAIVAFEQALERLVLGSYAKGVPVEETWEIIVPIDDAPNWTVTIEKTVSDDASSYQPSILDD